MDLRTLLPRETRQVMRSWLSEEPVLKAKVEEITTNDTQHKTLASTFTHIQVRAHERVHMHI